MWVINYKIKHGFLKFIGVSINSVGLHSIGNWKFYHTKSSFNKVTEKWS